MLSSGSLSQHEDFVMFQEEIGRKLAALDPHPFEIGPTSIIQGENTFHCIIACMILYKIIRSRH